MDEPNRPPALADIAKATGFSLSTVSRALNGFKKPVQLSEATQQLIKQTAKQMGYQPNLAARTLVRQRAGAIGILAAHTGRLVDQALQMIIHGVIDAAVQHGHSVVWYFSRDPKLRPIDVGVVQDGRVDAAVVIEDAEVGSDVIGELESSSIPLVMVGLYPKTHIPYVGTDDEGGMRQVVRHLIAQGHERIAFLGAEGFQAATFRRQGYRLAMEEAGLWDENLVIHSGFLPFRATEVVQNMISRKNPPTAYAAINDNIALGAIRALTKAGIQVGTDIAVVGFNDLMFAQFAVPSITTVRRPLVEVGFRAAELAMAIHSGDNVPNRDRQVVLPTTLVVRESAPSQC